MFHGDRFNTSYIVFVTFVSPPSSHKHHAPVEDVSSFCRLPKAWRQVEVSNMSVDNIEEHHKDECSCYAQQVWDSGGQQVLIFQRIAATCGRVTDCADGGLWVITTRLFCASICFACNRTNEQTYGVDQ